MRTPQENRTPHEFEPLLDSRSSHACTGDSCSQILVVPEIAHRLRVRSSWVYQHQADLPIFKLGKYLRSTCGNLSRFIAERGGCK